MAGTCLAPRANGIGAIRRFGRYSLSMSAVGEPCLPDQRIASTGWRAARQRRQERRAALSGRFAAVRRALSSAGSTRHRRCASTSWKSSPFLGVESEFEDSDVIVRPSGVCDGTSARCAGGGAPCLVPRHGAAAGSDRSGQLRHTRRRCDWRASVGRPSRGIPGAGRRGRISGRPHHRARAERLARRDRSCSTTPASWERKICLLAATLAQGTHAPRQCGDGAGESSAWPRC